MQPLGCCAGCWPHSFGFVILCPLFLIKKKRLGFCALCKLDLKIFLDVLSVPFEKS